MAFGSMLESLEHPLEPLFGVGLLWSLLSFILEVVAANAFKSAVASRKVCLDISRARFKALSLA